MPAGHHGKFTSWVAAALYLVAAVISTWPLASVLHREIAWDMGDPLFNSWVLMWTGGQVLAFLSGNMSALGQFWHGNIFHPEPHTLAYSDAMLVQAAIAAPFVWAGADVVVVHNLLMLGAIAFSGVTMFWLVRDLTRSTEAACVAGVGSAIAPLGMGW